MAVQSDDTALGVTIDAAGNERDLQAAPVVTFCGWVKTDGDSLRLFTDPWFVEWLEIPTSAVVHQVKGVERPHDEFRSTLWVLASADVTSYVSEPVGGDQGAEAADQDELAAARAPRQPRDRTTAGRVAREKAKRYHKPPPPNVLRRDDDDAS
jgi:hypothetical protein